MVISVPGASVGLAEPACPNAGNAQNREARQNRQKKEFVFMVEISRWDSVQGIPYCPIGKYGCQPSEKKSPELRKKARNRPAGRGRTAIAEKMLRAFQQIWVARLIRLEYDMRGAGE